VGQASVVEVDDAVEGPDGGADGPYPCGATHSSPSRGAGILLDAGGRVWTHEARIVHFMRESTIAVLGGWVLCGVAAMGQAAAAQAAWGSLLRGVRVWLR